MPNINFPFATAAQIRYIQILSDDLGYNLKTRDNLIFEITQRHCKPDALTMTEASLVIEEFKKWKEERK